MRREHYTTTVMQGVRRNGLKGTRRRLRASSKGDITTSVGELRIGSLRYCISLENSVDIAWVVRYATSFQAVIN